MSHQALIFCLFLVASVLSGLIGKSIEDNRFAFGVVHFLLWATVCMTMVATLWPEAFRE